MHQRRYGRHMTFPGESNSDGKTAATSPHRQPVRVLDGLASGRESGAVALVFEYMASTEAEAGRRVPASISQLPPELRLECQNLAAVYASPGALLIACQAGRLAGCVGLAPIPDTETAEVKRLYVRPGFRRAGIGRLLMAHLHEQAAQRRFAHLMLDVMPTRTYVIDFYRRLGYEECESSRTESPMPMISMQRHIPDPPQHEIVLSAVDRLISRSRTDGGSGAPAPPRGPAPLRPPRPPRISAAPGTP
jgi:ribosomal protein S18 acetylase RimI-like enzyme